MRPSRKALQIECPRCGKQQTVEFAGRFRGDNFYDLWHDYAALEHEYSAAREQLAEALERIEQLRFLVRQLEVPTPGQIAQRYAQPEPEEALAEDAVEDAVEDEYNPFP